MFGQIYKVAKQVLFSNNLQRTQPLINTGR